MRGSGSLARDGVGSALADSDVTLLAAVASASSAANACTRSRISPSSLRLCKLDEKGDEGSGLEG